MGLAALLIRENRATGLQKLGTSIQCVLGVAWGWGILQTFSENLLNLDPVGLGLDPKQAKVVKR